MEDHDKGDNADIDTNHLSESAVTEHIVNTCSGNETHVDETGYTKHVNRKLLSPEQHICSPNVRKWNENKISIYSRVNTGEDEVQEHSIEPGQFPNTDEYLMKLCDADQSICVPEVLAEIGITEELVEARRNTWLDIESMTTLHWRLQGDNFTWYHFDSQSEGTTTFGLDSDVNILIAQKDNRIILDINEWKQGFDNRLVHKQEDTSPGYCKLLAMNSGEPIIMTEVEDDEMYEQGDDGKVYLKCEFLQEPEYANSGEEVHGPAWNRMSTERGIDGDYVDAYYCSHIPKEAMDSQNKR